MILDEMLLSRYDTAEINKILTDLGFTYEGDLTWDKRQVYDSVFDPNSYDQPEEKEDL